MFSLIRTIHRPSRHSIHLRLVHNSGKNAPLPHRDWGVVGRLSRAPPTLSGEAPDGEEEGEEDATNVRYQTDNYTPESDPTPVCWAKHRASMKANFPEGWAPP